MSDRWERLLDQKPVPLQRHLIDEAARLLLAELGRWPLPIQEVDALTGVGVAELLALDAPRPSRAVLLSALRLARWELGREHDAYDDYMRNRRYQEVGLSERERPLLLLISRWLLEQLLTLSEATGGRVDRRALLEVVERLEAGLSPSGEAG